MNTYHKIQTVFKRDPSNRHRTLLEGQWTYDEFRYLRDNPWEFTEKVDGTNIRVQLAVGGDLTFGGKSDNAQIPAKLVKVLQERFTQEEMVKVLPVVLSEDPENPAVPVCLYGEGYGAKIQKGGGNYRPDQDFVLFDVKIGDWWLERENVLDIADQLNLEVVPRIGIGTLHDMIDLCKKGFNSQWGDFQAEGIVARPQVGLQDRGGRRIITKLKCKDFIDE